MTYPPDSFPDCKFTTRSAEETVALGRELARRLSPPKLVLLRGELGAGKTTLVKGVVEGFSAAAADNVTSPTFTIVHEYRSESAEIYHIDLYRIDTERALENLALDDLRGPESILLIEWGDKFASLRKERDIEIAIESVGEEERSIEITGPARIEGCAVSE